MSEVSKFTDPYKDMIEDPIELSFPHLIVVQDSDDVDD